MRRSIDGTPKVNIKQKKIALETGAWSSITLGADCLRYLVAIKARMMT